MASAPLIGYTHTVIVLHDTGETTSTLYTWIQDTSAGQSLKQSFPTFHWVFPRATAGPGSSPINAEGENGGREREETFGWFDGWEEGVLNENVGRLCQILHQEVRKLEGQWNRIIIVGVGQGAALATQTLLDLHVPSSGSAESPGLGAFIGISGQNPPAGPSHRDQEPNSALRSTPTLLQHCTDDTNVPLEQGAALRDSLISLGVEVVWRQYSTGGHGVRAIGPDGVRDLEEFLRQVIPQRDVEGRVAMPRVLEILSRRA